MDVMRASVPAADVKISRSGFSGHFTADHQGMVRAPLPEPGIYKVEVKSAGFQTRILDVNVRKHGLSRSVRLKVADLGGVQVSSPPAERRTEVWLSVEDSLEDAVPNAEVRVSGADGPFRAVTRTDKGGFARINCPTGDTYEVEVHALGFDKYRGALKANGSLVTISLRVAEVIGEVMYVKPSPLRRLWRSIHD